VYSIIDNPKKAQIDQSLFLQPAVPVISNLSKTSDWKSFNPKAHLFIVSFLLWILTDC